MASSLRNKMIFSYILIIISMLMVAGMLLLFLLRNYQVQIARTRLGERTLILATSYNDILNQTLRESLEADSTGVASAYSGFTGANLTAKAIPAPSSIRAVAANTLQTFYAELDRRNGDISTRILLIAGDGTIIYDSQNDEQSMRGLKFQQVAARKENQFIQGPRNYTDGSVVAGDKTRYIYGGAALNPSQTVINAVFLNQQRPPRLKNEAQARLMQEHLHNLLPRYVVLLQLQSEVESISELVPPLLFSGMLALLVSLLMAIILSRSIAQPLREITRASEAMALGNFEQAIAVNGNDEVSRLAASFNAMAVEVARSQRTLRDFVANVGHELKTPLTSIQGFSQALVDGTIGDEQMRLHAALIINEESQRMSRLIGQLLELARLESGQIEMVHQPIDLVALLQICCDKFTLRAEQGQVRLVLTVTPTSRQPAQITRSLLPRLRPALAGFGGVHSIRPVLPRSTANNSSTREESSLRVYGDPDRLEQVFSNLLDNALKHSPHAGTITIEVSRKPGAWVQVIIKDEGPGIPAADLSRIFERFYQVDKSRSRPQEGVGLGLAITREIVLNHGGSIQAESEYGHGARFRILLPLNQR